jgi:hypothetical protein
MSGPCLLQDHQVYLQKKQQKRWLLPVAFSRFFVNNSGQDSSVRNRDNGMHVRA